MSGLRCGTIITLVTKSNGRRYPGQESEQRELFHVFARRGAGKVPSLCIRIAGGDVPGHEDVVTGEQGVVAQLLPSLRNRLEVFRRCQ